MQTVGTPSHQRTKNEATKGANDGTVARRYRTRLRGGNHRRKDQVPRLDRRLMGGAVLAPKDFTPVCTTELGYMAKLKPEFERRGVKVIGLSVDATTDHEKWAQEIEETQGARPNYPII